MALHWVLSGLFPWPISVEAITLKSNVEDVAIADQVHVWYPVESYGTSKQTAPRSAADKQAQKLSTKFLYLLVILVFVSSF